MIYMMNTACTALCIVDLLILFCSPQWVRRYPKGGVVSVCGARHGSNPRLQGTACTAFRQQ